MKFGVTLKPDCSPDRLVKLAQQAEAAGFLYGWMFDSHILWKDPYPLLALLARATQRMHLGTCVTNPAVRDPTVTASLYATINVISGGRMELGIGRGDSSRRVLGKKPTTLERLEETIHLIRELTAGREVNYEGQPIRLAWSNTTPPVWVAGYGPKALHLAGRIADGVILQVADPDLIDWSLGFVRQGAADAGRDSRKIEVMAAAAVWVSEDVRQARERVRWFPALVSNHVVDLLSRYDPKELPERLTAYVRSRAGYDYQHHCEVESDNVRFVSDEIVDRFCLVGDVAAHRSRIEELRAVGVTQFNIYLMSGDEEHTLEVYGREILPHFARA